MARSERELFVGFRVSEEERRALKAMADRRDEPMSMTARRLLFEAFRAKKQQVAGGNMAGTLPAEGQA